MSWNKCVALVCGGPKSRPQFLSISFIEGGFLPDNGVLDSQLVLNIPTVSEVLGLQGATTPAQLVPGLLISEPQPHALLW